MVDVLTKKQRSFNMSQIQGKDTKPEIIVRRLVHSLGYRYRLHVKTLPGCPDLVFSCQKKVIFVHGCFWHRHNCKYGRVRPATRGKFWETKLKGNKERDKIKLRELRKNGWSVMTIWECQTRKPEKLIGRVAEYLQKS